MTGSPVLLEVADIVDTAIASRFTILLVALRAAGLLDTLKSPGPFTLFAPSDRAFIRRPPGTLKRLLQPENKPELRDLFAYHVALGKKTFQDVAKLQSMKTIDGRNIAPKTANGGVMVNNARVTMGDINASNGIIHVIDAVIIPEWSR